MSRIPLTDKMHCDILRLRQQSGVGPQKLISQWAGAPDNISVSLIWLWLRRKVKTVEPAKFDAVLKRWSDMGETIAITPAMHKSLMQEKDRVGIGALALFSNLTETPPQDLTPNLVTHWINRKTKTARRVHWDFIMSAYKQTTKESVFHRRYIDGSDYILLTDSLISRLVQLKTDSGVGPMRLLKGRKDKPAGLSSSNITTWLSGAVRSAPKLHIDFVIKAWCEVDPILSVTEDMVQSINTEFTRTGLGLTGYIRIYGNNQDSLTRHALQALARGKRSQLKSSQWLYLLKTLSAHTSRK